ncbi:hypothetical protein DNU06_15810 [Putridiphycobacter roseus]|uniref:Lipoprotein n=1 Tax=Putridiphycobacter roseus TaxID=2219161 RepID=A0A2W1N9B4_9FLAO|nr:hypothetical protein [Putridiphycobacter roseus]PZE15845.1 hypothetical protein DNU06_15810 [Putridiphycobacter roseus]
MRNILALIVCSSIFLTACTQKYNYPGELEVEGYKIGQMVDTAIFKKMGDLYFPNYLDGWDNENYDKLPVSYEGLPIAIWQLKTDSAIALTLLNNIVLNITVSYLNETQKNELVNELNDKFGAPGKDESYEQTHPLQAWITYWNLITWETENVIFQIGNNDMRKPKDPKPKDTKWNLAYSDFKIENKIISDYRYKK